MISKQCLLALIASESLCSIVVAHGNGERALQLRSENVQDASKSDGTPNSQAGESPSLTDDANFINFCTGKTLMNGAIPDLETCNGIVMGDIPSPKNMISTIILSPSPGDNLEPGRDFDIEMQVHNLAAGHFSNAERNYLAAPQQLKDGLTRGHIHLTIQSLGDSLAAQRAPDPTSFVFFKGINDLGDGKGGFKAAVTGGLPPGAYRACTMVAASNHQPVLSPSAQRGAQDDCQKFTVGKGKGNDGGQGHRNKDMEAFFEGFNLDGNHGKHNGLVEKLCDKINKRDSIRRESFASRRFIA